MILSKLTENNYLHDWFINHIHNLVSPAAIGTDPAKVAAIVTIQTTVFVFDEEDDQVAILLVALKGKYMLTFTTRALVSLSKIVFAISHFWNFNGYFTNYWTNTRHVCTLLNVFLTVIPNMGMKFHNFEIVYQICYIFDLSSALACRMESIKTQWRSTNYEIPYSICSIAFSKAYPRGEISFPKAPISDILRYISFRLTKPQGTLWYRYFWIMSVKLQTEKYRKTKEVAKKYVNTCVLSLLPQDLISTLTCTTWQACAHDGSTLSQNVQTCQIYWYYWW